MALPAHTIPAIPVSVLLVVLVPLGTVRLELSVLNDATIAISSKDIFFARDWFQMLWVAAASMAAGVPTIAVIAFVTSMVKLQSLWNRTDEDLIGDPMNFAHLSARTAERSVPVARTALLPFPATIWKNNDIRQKLLLVVHDRILHHGR